MVALGVLDAILGRQLLALVFTRVRCIIILTEGSVWRRLRSGTLLTLPTLQTAIYRRFLFRLAAAKMNLLCNIA